MQEEVTSKTIALAIKTAKLDGKVLQAALRQFMQLYRKKRDTPHRGKQTLKQLMLGKIHGTENQVVMHMAFVNMGNQS